MNAYRDILDDILRPLDGFELSDLEAAGHVLCFGSDGLQGVDFTFDDENKRQAIWPALGTVVERIVRYKAGEYEPYVTLRRDEKRRNEEAQDMLKELLERAEAVLKERARNEKVS